MCHTGRIIALVCFGALFSTIGKGQSVTMSFSYDRSGNLIEKRLQREDLKKGKTALEERVIDTVESYSGALNETATLALHVYPNPTEEKVTVDCPKELYGDLYALLYSPLGVLLEKRAISKTEHFDLSHNPAGVYLLQVFNNEKSFTWRIIKR